MILRKDESQPGNCPFYLKSLWKILKRSLILVYHYLDLIKDCYLIWSIIQINGGIQTLARYSEFPTVIALCLTSTVVFPLIFSSLYLTMNGPGIIFGIMNEELGGMSSKLMQILTFFSSFLTPVLLKNALETFQEKIEMATKNGNKTILMLKKNIYIVRHHLVCFMRIEFGKKWNGTKCNIT